MTIRERDLVLPAVYCIAGQEGISTTELIQCLRDLLRPRGEDLEILASRTDDKFSQKVRNLKSHDTLTKLNLANYSDERYWQVTDFGKQFLEENAPLLEYLISNGFDYESSVETLSSSVEHIHNKKRILTLYNETVQEGAAQQRNTTVYKRSSRLRDAAIEHYTAEDGRIYCAACGFSFEEFYGEYGRGFIEIHHLKPIYSYTEVEMEQDLTDALSNVAPLCANCHRMVHRERGKILPVEALRRIISDARHRNE